MKKTEHKSDPRDFEILFYERIVNSCPNYVEALRALAECYTSKGLYEEGLQMDIRLAKLCPKDSAVQYNLACSYALTHDRKAAFLALEKALELGYRDFKHLQVDQDLKSLHTEARFKELVSKYTQK